MRTIRTAVAAIAAHQTRMQAVKALSESGIELLSMQGDAVSAIQAAETHRPDLLVLDAQLPAMDGASLAERILTGFMLPVRPAVILLRYPEFPIANEAVLAASGAVLIEKPLDSSAFHAAVRAIRSAPLVFPELHVRHVELLLDALGVPLHRGRDCLLSAILICAADERCRHDLGGMLYPQLEAIFHLNASQCERAMRHAIGLAWQSDRFDNQYRIFADTVDAGRGQPTCGEMISRLADILRLEG